MTQIGETEKDPKMLEVLKATVASETGTYMQVERDYDDMSVYEPDDDILCGLKLDKLTCRRLHSYHCRYVTDGGSTVQFVFTVKAQYKLHSMTAQIVVDRIKGAWWVTLVSAQIRDTRPRANYNDEFDLWSSRSAVSLMEWDAKLRRMDKEQAGE